MAPSFRDHLLSLVQHIVSSASTTPNDLHNVHEWNR
jgi:hypothetical protein